MQKWMNSEKKPLENLRIVDDTKQKVTIDVFTSQYCSFCEDALSAARSAAARVACYSEFIEVKETSVDERPELIEDLNLVALPLIQVGREQIVGLPNQEDIERLIQTKLLMG